ncbi:protein GDAP2 homolog [Planococcus citri]|uniref:protein GDAP2 homolog n=1 Tax=Planococcus citri TaxID=170843 RepID=UPI0031FA4781
MEVQIDIENEPVTIDQLQRWSETSTILDSIYPINEAHRSPYRHHQKLNHRIILWEGDITNIRVDAIVHSSNRVYSDKSSITRRLLSKAGLEHRHEISQVIKGCPTGEVRVTHGYNLPCKYIIHTASPHYNAKYRTAAETSLASCYRNVLQKAYDMRLETLALCVINCVRYNYPPDEGAHTALRTVRKFLEMQEELGCVIVNTIVLVVESCDAGIYEVLLPLYFPRSLQEERTAVLRLPLDNDYVHNDRRIRIIDNPQHYTYGGDTILNMNDHAFTQMQGDLDQQRLLGDRPQFPSIVDQILAKEVHDKERYERLLRRAKTEDLSEISGIGCLYQSGHDRYGRPVIVFVGKWFRFKDINLDKALLYLIYLLDPLVKGDYVVMYFHTLTSSQNYASFTWLREVYNILPYKYKKNLKAFYVVHPTFWTKMMVWWFTTFMAPAIKQKVISISGIEYLYSIISQKELEIPAFITEYDMTINGIRYFQPLPSTST